MRALKTFCQAVLRRAGLYHRLQASGVYDLYWRLADRSLLEDRSREVSFYRNLLSGFRAGDLIFDVGANRGFKADIFLRLGGRIVAVEPDEFSRNVLEQKFRRYRLTPRPVVIVGKAASDRDSTATLWIDEPGSGKNTLCRKWVATLQNDARRFGRNLRFAQQRKIETTTLDRLMIDHGCPFFIKIDVEGHEASVLRGLARRVPFISFEVNLPEFLPEGLECVRWLGRLAAEGTFNYATDVKRGLVLGEWLAPADFTRVLEQCTDESIEVFWKSPVMPEAPAITNAIRRRTTVPAGMSVCVLNSGGQDHYLQALVQGLARNAWLRLTVIDFDHLAARLERHDNVKLLGTGPDRRKIPSKLGKMRALALGYIRSLRAIATHPGDLIHVQWLIYFEAFDRILIPLWCRLWGKRLLVTVHNVNVARRNRGRAGWMEQASLRFYYRQARALIAHTANIRADLIAEMDVRPENIFLIPHGINQQVPRRGMTATEARAKLDLPREAKVLLLFGSLAPYKGIDELFDAFRILCQTDDSYHFIIAGRPVGDGCEVAVEARIAKEGWRERTRLFLSFIADDRVETLFAAADCLVLPYRSISQSGVPFLAFGFGLPVVATAVGGLVETVQHGFSGMLAPPGDAPALARAIEACFAAGLHSPASRVHIREWAETRFSWDSIGDQTAALYRRLSASSTPVADRQEVAAL